jgi:hypothetical protein
MSEITLKTTEGVMLDVPTYNRLRSIEKFADAGPRGERRIVTLVYHTGQVGLNVPPETTIRVLSRFLAELSGVPYISYLQLSDGTLLEPSRNLGELGISDGDRLFGMLSGQVSDA